MISTLSVGGRSLKVVCNAYLALEAKIRLKINEQKTKYMIAGGNRTILDSGQTVAFSDRNFKVINKFVCLRALVTPKTDVSLEIQRRIKTAKMCICGLKKYLRSSYLARQKRSTRS
jgi:hypothetical protein